MPNTSLPGPLPVTMSPILVPFGMPSSSASFSGSAAFTSLACAVVGPVAVLAAFDFFLPLEHAPARRRTATAAAPIRTTRLCVMFVIGCRPLADRRHAEEEQGLRRGAVRSGHEERVV